MAEEQIRGRQLPNLTSRFRIAMQRTGQAVGFTSYLANAAGPQVSSSTRTRSRASIIGLPRESILSYSRGNYSVISSLTSLYSRVAESRKKYVLQHDRVRGFYLVEALLNAVADDSLSPQIEDEEIIQLTSKNKRVAKELEALQKNIQLDQLIDDIVLELLSYGEYNVRLEVEKGKGVVAVHDDVDQATVVAMYSQGWPDMYLWVNPLTGMLDVIKPWGIANFVIGKHRLRIDVHEEMTQILQHMNVDMSIWDEIPKYTRVGRPLLFGALGKIAELQTLEALIPAMKISRLASGSIVSVQIPSSQNPDDAFKICERYEEVLNRRINVDRKNQELTVAEITAAAGEMKVIPVWDNRGQLERSDVRGTQEAQDLLRGVEDNRNAICSSIGFPTEVLFGHGEETGKTNVLKRYARYVRNLKMTRRAVAHGCKQIAFTDLVNKGVSFHPDDVIVRYNNNLVDVDQLEVLEYIDASMNIIEQVSNFLTDVEERTNGTINSEGYKRWLADALGGVIKHVDLVSLKGKKSELLSQDEPANKAPQEKKPPPGGGDDGGGHSDGFRSRQDNQSAESLIARFEDLVNKMKSNSRRNRRGIRRNSI